MGNLKSAQLRTTAQELFIAPKWIRSSRNTELATIVAVAMNQDLDRFPHFCCGALTARSEHNVS